MEFSTTDWHRFSRRLHTGVRALLVHALHERAKLFYEYYGFQASPADPLVLMLRLSQAKP